MRIARLLLSVAFLSLAATGCKQPEGGRCQTADDCEPPLVCSTAEPRVCRPSGSEATADAAPAPDSRFDAHVTDANLQPTDAPISTTPDAAAATIDAASSDAP